MLSTSFYTRHVIRLHIALTVISSSFCSCEKIAHYKYLCKLMKNSQSLGVVKEEILGISSGAKGQLRKQVKITKMLTMHNGPQKTFGQYTKTLTILSSLLDLQPCKP